MGEGAGIVVLEELEHSTRARREDLWRSDGLWPGGDAYHITARGRRRMALSRMQMA